MEYEAFHCNIKITRHMPDSITGRDVFESTFENFFTRTPTSFITIGSSSKSSIIVNNINPCHCSFNFQQDTLFIKTMDKIVLIHDDKEIALGEGELYTLPFNPNELIDFYTLLEWKVIIHPYLELDGKITLDEGIEKARIEGYLQKKYMEARKLFESPRYLIYKIGTDRVAKILHPYYNKNPQQIERFFEVAKTTSHIHHELLCEIKAAYSDLPHILLEFFPGETLANYLAKKGRVGYRETFLVVKKIAEFLKNTREKGYVCKHLSLNNILCAGGKKIKYTGFGIPGYEIPLESPDIFYLDPQCINDYSDATFSSDIYSLGMIAFRLITGKFPFTPEEYQNYISQNISMSKNCLQKKSSYITPQIGSFLELMLSLDPQRRPTPSGVLDWLKDIFDIKLWHYVLNMEKENIHYGLQIISSVKPIRGEVCTLQDNKTFIIGRSADVNIPGDYRISRRHTKITLDNGVCILEDLGSSNGTKINGEKIRECRIESGTSFRIGETTLCFWDLRKLKEQREKG